MLHLHMSPHIGLRQYCSRRGPRPRILLQQRRHQPLQVVCVAVLNGFEGAPAFVSHNLTCFQPCKDLWTSLVFKLAGRLQQNGSIMCASCVRRQLQQAATQVKPAPS